MGVDYYRILEVSAYANEEELKKSYKRLAMKWHPDKNSVDTKEAAEKFKQSSEAYDVLSDPRKRRIYDLFGEEGLKSGVYPPPSPRDGGGRGFKFNPRDAEDIFEEFFVGTGGGSGLNTATIVENKLACSLEELYKGSKRKMKVSRIVLDEGSGKPTTVEEILFIHITPGWKKGTRITFPEKGRQIPGSASGDLVFIVDEKPHHTFKRHGNDLMINQKTSLLDALTGKTLSIRTLDGRDLILSTSDIIKPGHQMVIENEGMPISKEPGKYGDLMIKFDVKFPSRLTAEQKSDIRRILGRSSA